MDTDKLDAVSAAIGTVVSVITIVVVVRTVLGPDRLKLVRMRAALLSEGMCQRQAEGWAHMADACRKAYDQSRSVTV